MPAWFGVFFPFFARSHLHSRSWSSPGAGAAQLLVAPAAAGGSGAAAVREAAVVPGVAADREVAARRAAAVQDMDITMEMEKITGVWLKSPSPGQNQANVQVNAIAYGPATVTQWTVCLDGQAVYQTNNAATSISQAIDIPAGQHLLWASAADAQGDSDRSEIRLIQVGPPPPSSTVLPTPPANAQVLTEMQNDTANWSICSLCAAGTTTTGNYRLTFSQSQPSLSGSSLEMYVDGPQWSNVLFIDTMLGTSSNSHFLFDFWVYHDPASEAHFWASEFDLWQVLSGNEFMIGSQCDFGDGYWATWDSQGDAWVLNGIPCPHWAPGWHHIQWYVERISSTSIATTRWSSMVNPTVSIKSGPPTLPHGRI